MTVTDAPRIRTEVQLMFFDTDCGGVVHNIAYLRFIEIARTLLVEQLGLALSDMAATQKYPVVVRTEIDYRRAAKLGDRLRIEGWLDHLERVRFCCAFPIVGTDIAQRQRTLTKMVAGTGTLSIEETFLGPQALPPPPTRHALFAILISLGVLLHFGTIGIGDLYSETEGQYAAAAREMIQSGQYLLPTNDRIPRLQKPPLLYWLIVASYKVFGINTAATRVPIAFSVVATLAFTFLIGERLADYWRGFAAGLIYLTLTGTFIFGRIVMPEPLFAALFAGAIYCGLAGFQQRHQRRAWFAGFWICAALACLTKGPHGLFFPAATFAALAIFYREARTRFRSLLW